MIAQTKIIANINKVDIVVIENGQKLVPIRPICKAFGIDEDSQKRKIQGDEILGSVATLSVATGADGKNYEMFCIPYRYVFGWLFSINSKNVKVEAQDAVRRYKRLCYDILYQNFSDHTEFLEQKQAAMQQQLDKVQEVRAKFRNTQYSLKQESERLNGIKDLTFEQWLANNRQLQFEFVEPAKDEDSVTKLLK
ncbi:phage antirepressor N-terminal domain-containing protein [Pontibacter beigongshangensis]|uniref:phage antirepressor N-terminal domain-containing protein n=1 Tax=Pontibacter beigongshangensis TaxID=2574733 RepID=UPI00164F7CA5|nr:phage antirepressor N-terminal domain-containing protein [Pontibacter beigongshangensis]